MTGASRGIGRSITLELAQQGAAQILLVARNWPLYTTVPNSAPTAAVSPVASAPQKVTRTANFITGAPPARAASMPSIVKKIKELPKTVDANRASGATSTVSSGIAAPNANAPAEAKAA